MALSGKTRAEMKVNFPENIKTVPQRVTYWIFYHLYIWELGRGAVIGRFTTMFTEISVFFLFLDRFFYKFSSHAVVVTLAIGTVVTYIMGYYYRKYDLDLINSQVTGERQHYFRELTELAKKNAKGEISND